MLHPITTLGLLAGMALLAPACAELTAVSGPAPESQNEDRPEATALRTDSSVYHVRTTANAYEVTIGVAFTNPTDGRVYIPTCHTPHPPVLQKRANSGWVTAYNPPVLMCLGPPVVIEAGQTYHYTYRIVASRPAGNFEPSFQVDEIPGTYRLQWHMLSSWTAHGPEPGLGQPLPLEHTTSNTFELRLP